MFVSGRDALTSVESAIGGVRADETRLASVLSSAAAEAERLRRTLAESFRALALVRLDAIVRNDVVGELDAAERRALGLLRTHKDHLDALLLRQTAAQKALASAEADHRASTSSVNAAGEPVKALQAATEERMKTDAAWTAQRARVDEAAKIANAAAEKAAQAEADREIKRKPYEGDPLFMYLWKRGFATSSYRAGNVVRFFDRRVAFLVGYDRARPNYALLIDIPQRLREHASELVARVEQEDRRLEELERAALEQAGILKLEADLTAAEEALAAATETLGKAQQALAALDRERGTLTGEGDRKAHDEALAVLTQALSREDLQTMYREARATGTPEDDRLVRQIEVTQSAIGKADAEVARIRDEAREIARRRGELEGVRDRFRSRRYDGPWGQFEFDRSNAVGDLIGGIVRGAIQGAVLSELFEKGYRKRRDWDDDDDDDRDDDDDDDDDRSSRRRDRPRFRLPSSSFPRIGGFGGRGGGFRTGGGFKSGGFRTGGKF